MTASILARLALLSCASLWLAAPALAQDAAPEPAQTSTQPAAAGGDQHLYAMSLIGKPKYPPGFTHFDYVNPDAPKGGTVRMAGLGSFNSLNPVLYRGDKPSGLGLVYETLMAQSLDQDSTEYGLIAEWASHPADDSSVTFKLRDNARWQDGTKITPEDVIYSFDIAKKADPSMGLYYKNVEKAEKVGDDEVKFIFSTKNNRELPYIMGQLTIIPKHYWTGKDKNGKQRDPLKTTLEPPLGSGPYTISKVEPGRSITYTRVKDYWGRDLPVNKGQWNFDTIRFDYFQDPGVAFQAFKAGDLDVYNEQIAKNWATAYDFDAVKKGQVIKQRVPIATAQPMQCFAFNLRRAKFDDPRVRRAFNLAFDFEWSNKNLFYGQYKRTGSFFANTELAAPKALPKGQELKDLEQIKNEVPPEVFTKVYQNPTTNPPSSIRDNLREAMELLQQAGWQVKNGVLTNVKTGEPMKVEFLIDLDAFQRVIEPYIRNLKVLGIQATERLVDPSQYQNRLQDFDFDIVVNTFPQSRSPGNEQRDFWGSGAADRPGSQNIIGIKDKGVDALVDDIIFAKDRADLVAATHALDRVLLWHNYVVPQWYSPYVRMAYWNRFDQPKTLPALTPAFLQVWWYDAAKAARLPKH